MYFGYANLRLYELGICILSMYISKTYVFGAWCLGTLVTHFSFLFRILYKINIRAHIIPSFTITFKTGQET
jgi:hypothetical protein